MGDTASYFVIMGKLEILGRLEHTGNSWDTVGTGILGHIGDTGSYWVIMSKLKILGRLGQTGDSWNTVDAGDTGSHKGIQRILGHQFTASLLRAHDSTSMSVSNWAANLEDLRGPLISSVATSNTSGSTHTLTESSEQRILQTSVRFYIHFLLKTALDFAKHAQSPSSSSPWWRRGEGEGAPPVVGDCTSIGITHGGLTSTFLIKSQY